MSILRPAKFLACAMLALLVCAPAFAQKAGASPEPHYVDLGRVLEAYRKTSAFSKYAQRLRQQETEYTEELRFLAQLRYCTDQEKKEALALKANARPSAKEKARLDALLKKSDNIDNEMALLSQKDQPTKQESERIQTLSKLRADATQNLAKEAADRRDQLRKLDSDMREEVQAELLKIVEKVAKEQKVPTVYNRLSVLHGGTDLTDLVIKKLPK